MRTRLHSAVRAEPEYPPAGQDATEAFYALHRHEVLQRPQYARLQIGTVKGEESVVVARVAGALSKVPYAEPTWLTDGYHSPYFKEVSIARQLKLFCSGSRLVPQSHKKLQRAMRQFVDEVVYPDAQLHEEDGKRPSLEVIDKMAYVCVRFDIETLTHHLPVVL